MSKCDKCYGCSAQELEEFTPPSKCTSFIDAYICPQCKSEMYKYPNKSLCPNCDNTEWLRTAKEYMSKVK